MKLEELTRAKAAIERKLDNLKGSTATLRQQYDAAVLELKQNFGIDIDSAEHALEQARANAEQIYMEIEAALVQFLEKG